MRTTTSCVKLVVILAGCDHIAIGNYGANCSLGVSVDLTWSCGRLVGLEIASWATLRLHHVRFQEVG